MRSDVWYLSDFLSIKLPSQHKKCTLINPLKNNKLVMFFYVLCADGGEEQAAAGEAGACRAEAPADHEEGWDASWSRSRTGPEDSCPHQGRKHDTWHVALTHTHQQMPSSPDISVYFVCTWCQVMTFQHVPLLFLGHVVRFQLLFLSWWLSLCYGS